MSRLVVVVLGVAVALAACGGGGGGDGTASGGSSGDEAPTTCGDGVVDPGEVCDDGINDGRYGGCMPFCQVVGPYCGNGVVDAEEVCDDGLNDGFYGSCSVDCQTPMPRCGDGVLDPVIDAEVCEEFTCCHEKCEPAPDLDLPCQDCVVRPSEDMSGCDLDEAPPFSITVTGSSGDVTLTRGFFAEHRGEVSGGSSVTGSHFILAAEGVTIDDLLGFGGLHGLEFSSFEHGGLGCTWNGIPSAGRWEGRLEGAQLFSDAPTEFIDVALVVDGKDPDAPVLRGHLEGAVTGEFAARYCDALINYGDWQPD